jgi:hypothetical protein
MFAADRPSSLDEPRHNALPGLRYGSMNPRAHNLESEYYHQDRKRLKTDEVTRSVVRHSSYQTARPAHPPMVRESRNSSNNNWHRLPNKLPGVTSIARSSSSQGGARLGSNRDPDMRQCNTIEDLVHTAYDHLVTISLRGIAAFWSLLVKHVQNHRGDSLAQLNEQLAKILCNTLENMKRYSHIGISTIAISLAKIMKQVESREQRAATGSLHHSLHNLLIGGDNSKKKQCILNNVAKASILILSKFDARHLSNLIFRLALLNTYPRMKVDAQYLVLLPLRR